MLFRHGSLGRCRAAFPAREAESLPEGGGAVLLSSSCVFEESVGGAPSPTLSSCFSNRASDSSVAALDLFKTLSSVLLNGTAECFTRRTVEYFTRRCSASSSQAQGWFCAHSSCETTR